jgi:hypothetical protein
MSGLAGLWAAFQRADAESGNLLGLGLVVVLVLLVAIALPPARNGSPWGRIWTCGTVGALAVLVLFLPR